MDGESNKMWNRPWSTEEIIQNSENWSLAGDVALLNTIKAFANNLLTKTDALNSNINNLLHNLDEVGLKLDISQNDFQNLKNTQFIESRVYDDDETMDSKESEKVTDDHHPEKLEVDFDASLNSEIKLLDKYYEMVEISISDSEDESEKSFVLKPKDMYESRQLPPLIGSDEWYKNWYIEDQTSDVDSQKSSEVYSESDSEDNLPKDLFNGSETSSELNFSNHANERTPVANSTFKDNVKKHESVISSEESDDLNSLPAKAPVSNKTFAEQLAAKLDSVISREENLTPEVNTKPIQPPKTDTFSAGLFSNEPPPLSDNEDRTIKGIFSGGKNLFDNYDEEEDDSLFWDNQKKESPPFEIKKEDIKRGDVDLPKNLDKNDVLLPKSSQVSKGLFDSDNSDDDLFVPKTQNTNKSMFLQSNKPNVPLFDEEPPSLDNPKEGNEPAKKKPIGGVSIFGNKDIGDILKNMQQNTNQNVEKAPLNQNKLVDDTTNKKINLFDDDEDDFFKTLDNKPKTKKMNLFDNSLDNNNKVENNNKTAAAKNDNLLEGKDSNTVKKSKVISLFDDDDDLSNDDDIFTSNKKPLHPKSNINARNLNLFGDEDDINKNKPSIGTKKNVSLFDNDQEYEEIDIKGDKKDNEEKIKNNSKNFAGGDNGNNNKRENRDFNKVDLIEENPPINKKTDLLGTNSLFSPIKEEIPGDTKKASLFDDDASSKRLQKLYESDIKKPVSSEKSKKISLFDDDDEEDDDIFSNVTKQIDFKLFEDPESTEDLFSIKKAIVSEDVDIKNAEIKKTSDIIRNEENVKTIIKESQDQDSKLDKSIISKEATDNNDNKNQDKNDIKDSKSQSKSLFDDDMVNKNDKIPEDVKHNIFEDQKEKVPAKPKLTTKPQLISSTNEFRSAEIATTSTTVTPPAPPVVNLFGSTPPPVDDDWDTKSDNFSDTEDFVSFREEENSQRSSVFDNEPPSLNGYESSGITRDYSRTRIDTDDSSFYPYANSSRRLSSDIFSDQQSQDSFFLTKNKTESSTNPSHLDMISEDSKMSTIDVTPSGQLEESTESKKEEVTDNVVSNKSISDSVIEKNHKDNLVSEVKDEEKNKDKIERKANIEKSLNKIASITERLKNQSPTKSPEKKGSPGKLKPTLNINVNALLPGLSQPKIKALTKTQAKEEDIDTKDNSTSNINTPTIKTDNFKDTSQSPIDLDTPVGFDVTDNANILSSITKERVRNPARRKPSTRRARQEALRSSMVEGDALDIPEPPKDKPELSKEKNSNYVLNVPQLEEQPLSVDTKKHSSEKERPSDIPRLPLVTKSELEKKLLSRKPVPKTNLFGSESDSDHEDDLFGASNQRKTKIESKKDGSKNTEQISKTKNDLFDETPTKEDELEHLFDTSKSKKNNTETKLEDDFESESHIEEKSLKTDTDKSKNKKSLFDDSSSDDELFIKSSKGSKKKENTTKPVEKKITPSVKKLENIETNDDPLSNLLD